MRGRIRLYRTVAAAMLFCGVAATAAAQDAPLELTAIAVSDDPKAGVPYYATLSYELADGAEISNVSACFLWSGEGPYCFNARNDRAAATFTVQLKTKNAGDYTLAAFVRYSAGGEKLETGTVETDLEVAP